MQLYYADTKQQSSGESPELIQREGGLVTAVSNEASGEVGVEDDKAGESISVDSGKVQQEPNALETSIKI